MLRVVHERVVGELHLPSTVSVVAAANPPETAVGGSDLSAPLANRFLHLDWEVGVGEWAGGMEEGWSAPTVPRVPEHYRASVVLWKSQIANFRRTKLWALPFARRCPRRTVPLRRS
jgi:hypothetical protein